MIVDSMINKLGKSPDEIAQQAVMKTSPVPVPQQTQIPQSPQPTESPQPTIGVSSPQELDMQVMSAADQQMLDNLLQRGQLAQSAPLNPIGQELALAGQGDDTELAHLTAGEVVIPPEMLEDEEFESMLEMKFRELGINPEEAVVGSGVASLNPMTGLEEFGFFKKLGRRLKKFAKKIAPVAGPLANFIPGVGPVIAGAIGAGTNLVAGKGFKGALTGALSGYGTGKAFGNIANVGGMGDAAFAKAQFGDKLRALKSGFQQGGIRSIFGNVGQAGGQQLQGVVGGSPILTGDTAGEVGQSIDLQSMVPTIMDETGRPIPVNEIVDAVSTGGRKFSFLDDILGIDKSGAGLVGSIRNRLLGGGQQGEGGGGLLGGGGLGSLLGLAGAGALAGKLGQLAFQEAKNQRGVPLTPLTTMDASGRYNIEAEIARRTGQPAPNPVEFGLLPQGTIPELSGGQPRPMAYGGEVYGNGLEDLTGGLARGMAEGGEVDKKTAGFVMRMEMADKKIDGLIPPATSQADQLSMETGAVISDKEIEYDQRAINNVIRNFAPFEDAARQFTTGVLRKETGAVISESEIDNVISRFVPQVGDSPDTIAQKSRARKDFIQFYKPFLKQETKSVGTASFMGGGPVMQYAQGGAVQRLQEGGELEPQDFPRRDGPINGAGTETSDDIPAMLSDGEFVMTGRAVRGAGSYEIQNQGGIISLVPSLEEDRNRGMENMYKIMDAFESSAQPSS